MNSTEMDGSDRDLIWDSTLTKAWMN